jgi:hypothetical protein
LIKVRNSIPHFWTKPVSHSCLLDNLRAPMFFYPASSFWYGDRFSGSHVVHEVKTQKGFIVHYTVSVTGVQKSDGSISSLMPPISILQAKFFTVTKTVSMLP